MSANKKIPPKAQWASVLGILSQLDIAKSGLAQAFGVSEGFDHTQGVLSPQEKPFRSFSPLFARVVDVPKLPQELGAKVRVLLKYIAGIVYREAGGGRELLKLIRFRPGYSFSGARS